MKRLLLMLMLILLARPVAAGQGLDVKDWLMRPGVKLLAVEFYASWCEPCRKAVPHWKSLHETYRDQGFRLVVVSVQDPDGMCVNPGWNPDDVICDVEGNLAKAWGVGERLPAAFLWSWRGGILVRGGHLDEVKRKAIDELRRIPRVALDAKMSGSIKDLVRSELAKTGKVVVVAEEDEQEALTSMRRESRQAQYLDKTACKLGERLAANSLLKAKLVEVNVRKRLLLQLFNAETGCLHASAGVHWSDDNPEISIAEAVDELLNNLRLAVDMPGPQSKTQPVDYDIGETKTAWKMDVSTGIPVKFQSEPGGAVVLVDGRLRCQSTPCSKTLQKGRHKVEMQKESYLPKAASILVETGMKAIRFALTPDFGWITVVSSPSGLPVQVDGEPVGSSPLSRHRVSTGRHEVLVTDARYHDSGKRLHIEPGESETIDVQLEPREGGLVISAHDDQGNDLEAEIFLDGEPIGKTPLAKQLLIGQHELKVAQKGQQLVKKLVVQEKQVEEVAIEFKSGGLSDPDYIELARRLLELDYHLRPEAVMRELTKGEELRFYSDAVRNAMRGLLQAPRTGRFATAVELLKPVFAQHGCELVQEDFLSIPAHKQAEALARSCSMNGKAVVSPGMSAYSLALSHIVLGMAMGLEAHSGRFAEHRFHKMAFGFVTDPLLVANTPPLPKAAQPLLDLHRRPVVRVDEKQISLNGKALVPVVCRVGSKLCGDKDVENHLGCWALTDEGKCKDLPYFEVSKTHKENADPNSLIIVPLREAIASIQEGRSKKKVAQSPTGEPGAVIILHAMTPFRLLFEVMYTISRQGAKTGSFPQSASFFTLPLNLDSPGRAIVSFFQGGKASSKTAKRIYRPWVLIAEDHFRLKFRDQRIVRKVRCGGALGALRGCPSKLADPLEAFEVVLKRRPGLVCGGKSAGIDYDRMGLYNALQNNRTKFGLSSEVFLGAQYRVPWQTVAKTIDAVMFSLPKKEYADPCVFERDLEAARQSDVRDRKRLFERVQLTIL